MLLSSLLGAQLYNSISGLEHFTYYRMFRLSFLGVSTMPHCVVHNSISGLTPFPFFLEAMVGVSSIKQEVSGHFCVMLSSFLVCFDFEVIFIFGYCCLHFLLMWSLVLLLLEKLIAYFW